MRSGLPKKHERETDIMIKCLKKYEFPHKVNQARSVELVMDGKKYILFCVSENKNLEDIRKNEVMDTDAEYVTVKEEKDMDDVARSLSKAVVILSSNGKIIDQLKLSIFHPHTDVTKNR